MTSGVHYGHPDCQIMKWHAEGKPSFGSAMVGCTCPQFRIGDVVRIADNCTDEWTQLWRGELAIVRNDVLSIHPGQEGRLAIWVVYGSGSYRSGGVCLPEFLVPAADEAALIAKAGYERIETARAEREEILTRERSAIAVKHGLAPDIAERFYQERRDWEYDHGDDG